MHVITRFKPCTAGFFALTCKLKFFLSGLLANRQRALALLAMTGSMALMPLHAHDLGEKPCLATGSIARQADCDSVASLATDSTQPRRGVMKRLYDYFRNSNKPKPQKRIDFGVLPGPHYSATTGLGLGIMATATYSTDRLDKALPRSNASIFTDMTTKGFFLVGVLGNHIWPKERYRLDYKLTLSTFSTQFWGIGYEMADVDANETNYRRNRVNAMARFMFRIAPKTYFGPLINYRYMQAKDIAAGREHLWQGQALRINAKTVGVSFTYDSRDYITNASRGLFMQIDQTFTPRFLANGRNNFSTTEATLAKYIKVWKGGVLAGELHGQFNYGHTPWALLSEVGSNNRMRGYYEGRYRDKQLVEGQVELRQNIRKRHGVALWVAAANVAPKVSEMAFRKTLPNAGIGYRWEFKHKVNVRIDYGFTRHGGGFIFCVNEAF